MFTKAEIKALMPKDKRNAVLDAWEDSDGIWIILKDGWNADNSDSVCRTIHCGGEDEPPSRTLRDLKYQINGIRKL